MSCLDATGLCVGMAIVCFSGLSLLNKIAERRQCETAAYVGAMNAIACVFSLVMLQTKAGSGAVPGAVLALGVGGGIISVLCLTCVLAALRSGGPLTIVITLGNLSILIPIVFSMVFFGEKLTLQRLLGLVLFAVFVALLNWPEQEEKA